MGKIYTGKGDKGQTGLANGKRVLKSDLRIEVLGTIDELNSAIGVVIAEVQSSKFKVQSYSLKLKVELVKIQNDLLNIGSVLANTKVSSHKLAVSGLEKRVKDFEKLIDRMTEQMPPLKNFILPGGGKAGANLHLTRAVCRRAERKIVELNRKKRIDGNIIIYFNRLSDLLFTLARFVNFKEKKKEGIWIKNG